MNILFTSAGRRTYIVEYFQEVLKPIGGKVFVVNSDSDAPAMWVANSCARAPMIHDPDYPDFLLKYSLENQIDCIIPLFDLDLPVLADLKEVFLRDKIHIIVADKWICEMANDKWQTQSFLKVHGFPTRPSFLTLSDCLHSLKKGKAAFPFFVKPRWGMGSIGLFKAEDLRELEFYFLKVSKEIQNSYLNDISKADQSVLIQEGFPGKEYGLDIINDLDGNYLTTIVKEKLAMRSGETDVAITIDEPILVALGKKIAGIARHPGNMDVDVFFDGVDPFILEFNPRFGGGYPFSHQAGANLPQVIVDCLLGKEIKVKQYLQPRMGVKSMKGIALVTKLPEAGNY